MAHGGIVGKILFGLSFLLAQVGYADDLQFTCRGQSPEYGHFAVSIETGIVGKATFRNCRLAKELAEHIGAPAKSYDSFVMSSFLGGKCVEDASLGEGLKCTFTPSLGEEDLDDEVGVEVELGVTKGSVLMAAKPDGTNEVQVWLARPTKDFAKTIHLPKLECEDGLTIQPDEGVCK